LSEISNLTQQGKEASSKGRIKTELKPRLNWDKAAPGAMNAMLGLGKYLQTTALESSLKNLVLIRASQINGCAYCLDMHAKDARVEGESEQRLYLVSGWRETPIYTERERAALAWTEAVTLVADTHVPDEIYEEARKQFGEKELVDLTLVIISINGWNRLNVAFRTVAGSYKPMKWGQPQH
jgi:AhpD family alkylhydroperoxidase